MRLPWCHQNPLLLDGHHTYVTSEIYTNTTEMQCVRHTVTTQYSRGLQYHQISIGIQKDYSIQSVIF